MYGHSVSCCGKFLRLVRNWWRACPDGTNLDTTSLTRAQVRLSNGLLAPFLLLRDSWVWKVLTPRMGLPFFLFIFIDKSKHKLTKGLYNEPQEPQVAPIRLSTSAHFAKDSNYEIFLFRRFSVPWDTGRKTFWLARVWIQNGKTFKLSK